MCKTAEGLKNWKGGEGSLAQMNSKQHRHQKPAISHLTQCASWSAISLTHMMIYS